MTWLGAAVAALGCGRTGVDDLAIYQRDEAGSAFGGSRAGASGAAGGGVPTRAGSGGSSAGRGGSSAGRGGVSSGGGGAAARGGATGAGGNVSRGGTLGVGASGGVAGAGATTTSNVVSPESVCRTYCDGYAKVCATELRGRDCFRNCLTDLSGGSDEPCITNGSIAMQCMAPSFSPLAIDCYIGVTRALDRCGSDLGRFENCRGMLSTPVPTRSPVPAHAGGDPNGDSWMPASLPASPVDFSRCREAYRDDGGVSCDREFSCDDGASFHTHCYIDELASTAGCTCKMTANGHELQRLQLFRTDRGGACEQARALCY